MLQRLDGRISIHTVSLQTQDTGEQVMRMIRLKFEEETRAWERFFSETLLVRKPAASIARITFVSPG